MAINGDDLSLWQRVMDTIRPLNRGDVLPMESTPTPSKPKGKPTLPSSQACNQKHAPDIQKHPSSTIQTRGISPIDRATWRKIDRGTMAVGATLDVHGMTANAAHHAFNSFVVRNVTRGHKCIIVITGKGKGGAGIIRRELPLWAGQGRNPSMIVAMGQPPKNKGCYYIILRRRDKIK